MHLRQDRVFWLTAAGCSACLLYFYAGREISSTIDFSPIFRHLLVFNDLPVARLSVFICALAAATRWPQPFETAARFLSQHSSGIAFAAVFFYSAGAISIYRAYLLSMDEYAAVFQSKVFAAGSVVGQMPAGYARWLIVSGFNGEFFDASDQTGQIIETYLAGFALIMAPFSLIHASWACNPILAGLSIWLIHWITLEISGSRLSEGVGCDICNRIQRFRCVRCIVLLYAGSFDGEPAIRSLNHSTDSLPCVRCGARGLFGSESA